MIFSSIFQVNFFTIQHLNVWPLQAMTLDTKVLLAAHLQLPFKICTMGIMTGDTGGHLAVSWVNHLFSYRMAELPLALMAW